MPLSHNQEILFTRQKHEAERAGLHYDYRIVVGDKAFSWATKKDLPKPGTSILLHEQPLHTAHYALSKRVVIPTGQYGAGVTTLDWVGKGKIDNPEEDLYKFVVKLNDGQRFLIKKLPEKYGPKAWLFKNLTKKEGDIEKTSSELEERFRPDLTPEEMKRLGVLAKQYFHANPNEANFFHIDASLSEWPKEWIDPKTAPMGWFNWYQGYAAGKRTSDDERQIKRWISFKARHLAQLKKADPSLEDFSIQPRRRQALLNWGIAPGDKNKYLEKIAANMKDHSFVWAQNLHNRYLEKIAQHLKDSTQPEHLGIDLSNGDENELNKWLIAVTLLSRPIQRGVAERASKQLSSEGITNPEAVQRTGYDGLVKALGRGHYVRYDFSMSDALLSQAEHLRAKYGTIKNLVDNRSPEEIRKELQTFKGIGPLGSKLFIEGLAPHIKKYRGLSEVKLTPIDPRQVRLREILVNSSRGGSFNPYSENQYDWNNSKDINNETGKLVKFQLFDKHKGKMVELHHPEITRYRLRG